MILFQRLPKAIQEYADEQAAKPKSKVEVLARAYCEELGYDPDGKIGGDLRPMWMRYRNLAEEHLRFAAMDRALRKTGVAEE